MLLRFVSSISIKYDYQTVSILYVVLFKEVFLSKHLIWCLLRNKKHSPEKSRLESALITIPSRILFHRHEATWALSVSFSLLVFALRKIEQTNQNWTSFHKVTISWIAVLERRPGSFVSCFFEIQSQDCLAQGFVCWQANSSELEAHSGAKGIRQEAS